MTVHRLPWVAGLTLALLAAPAFGQTASALIREGGPLPGDDPANTVSSINNPNINHANGYGFSVNTNTPGGATISHVWGHPTGGLGTVLRSEGIFGDYEQTSYESWWGMSNAGEICYSPISNHIPSGSTSLDGVWVDAIPVAVEETVYPHLPGYWWSFGSRPDITADGKPYFVGGITDTFGGSTDNRGLFFGFDTQPLLFGGESYPGLPFPLSTASTVSFDYRMSALGNNYLAEVVLDTTSATDAAMVLNGAGLVLGGTLVREGNAVPAAIGGLPGENWANFDFLSITEGGQWLMTGDTSADAAVDEFVIVDGTIIMREGMATPDGNVINGAIEAGYMNANGDWGVIWDVDTAKANVEVLIVNGETVLMEGMEIDWDGNGLVDDGVTLIDFTGISAMCIGDQRPDGSFDVFFVADCNVGGTTLEGAFRLTIPEPATLTLLAVAGLVLRRRR